MKPGGRLVLRFVVVLSVVLCVVMPVAPAFGASNGRWSVYPTTPPDQAPRPYFAPVMAPGSSYPDSVTVANQTPAPMTFDLYAADAFNAGGGGAFSLRRKGDPEHGIGAWLHLQYSTVTVPGNSSVEVPFTIDPPADATPGYHVGGIVAQSTQVAIRRYGPIGVAVIQAVGTRVYGRILGPLHPALSVTSTSLRIDRSLVSQFGGAVRAGVAFSVKNTGNVPLSPTAVASLSALIGGTAASWKERVPQVLPGSSLTVTEPARSIVPWGSLAAHVLLRSAQAGATGQTSSLVVPWGLVLVVLALVVSAVAWRRWQAGRRARPRHTSRHGRGQQAPDQGGGRVAAGRKTG